MRDALLLQRGDTLGDPLGDGESERSIVLPGVPTAAITTGAAPFNDLLIIPKHLDAIQAWLVIIVK
ncbi:hypothetical protein FIBSPDRAFT_875676 [Athelia psychrophila]|uniref:Uncharacterized protein n=1 Tax=Athelia psychrophila TaxID=1759441 RepID=A0A167XJA8_9AGAM|nr:hypothetical protein FIBSPDRAFT_875676 [Fibularhizoctonia sp. CBS 109695]